jgi:predicted anti-sigma-YlaC factor YlaD
MNDQAVIAAKVEHARNVERALQWLGWLVACLGIAGIAVFSVYWALGDLNDEQAVSLLIGTALASILSGATVYGAGVNVGLGAERLDLAARPADQSGS